VIMPKATPAPKTKFKVLLFIPYTYALVTVSLAVWQLVSFNTFVQYVAGYDGGVINNNTVSLAIILASLEVFSVPFLIRLKLSPAARLFSALFVVIAPLAWSLVLLGSDSYNIWYLAASLAMLAWAYISFIVLGGTRVVKLPTKRASKSK
jgi:hypothetical protein